MYAAAAKQGKSIPDYAFRDRWKVRYVPTNELQWRLRYRQPNMSATEG